jgi:hypothetical protein
MMFLLLFLVAACGLRIVVVSKLQGSVAQYPLLVTALNAERAADQTIVVSHGAVLAGSDESTSRVLDSVPAMLQLSATGVLITSLGQTDFIVGLSQTAALLDAWGGTVVCANVRSSVIRVDPCKVVFNVAFCGVLTLSSQTALSPELLIALNVTQTDMSDLIAARNTAALNGATFFVALLDTRLPLVSLIPAYIADITAYFDVIALGLEHGVSGAFTLAVNGSLVVSSSSDGKGFVRISVPDRNMTMVTVNAATVAPNLRAELELSLWQGGAIATQSAKTMQVSSRLAGQSLSTASNGLKYKKLGENPIGALCLDAVRSYANVSIAVFNTGSIQSDLPSTFAPTIGLGLRRMSPPFDLVTGDCGALDPFQTAVVLQNASSSELCKIASWCANGDATKSALAKGLQGYMRGMKLMASYSSNGSSSLLSFSWPNGTSVDCNCTSDWHTVALLSFLVSGGSGFPVFPLWRPVELRTSMASILCAYTSSLKGQAPVSVDSLLPFDAIVVREEMACAPVYTMEVLPGFNVTLFSVQKSICSNMTIRISSASPRQFSSKVASLTSVSSILAPPNEYATVVSLLSDSIVVGQLVGYVMNVTFASTNDTEVAATVRICLPEASFIPLFGRFSAFAIATSRNGGPFRVLGSASYTPQDNGYWGTYCSNVSLPLNEVLLIAPVRTAQLTSSFNVAEQVFLFLFGVLYLAVAVYCSVLLVRRVAAALVARTTVIDLLLVVRVELILIAVLRCLYFCMIGFGVFASNVFGAYFLLEFPFILDFSVYCSFIYLFFSVFQVEVCGCIRRKDGNRVWIVFVLLNIGLFCFFFAVFITYITVAGSNLVVLAYRVTLASIAIMVVILFGIYAVMLLRAVHEGRRLTDGDQAPLWLPHMSRLAAVAIMSSVGVLAIFIVILYSALQPVIDPVLSSAVWLICFLFFAELVPIIAIMVSLLFSSPRSQETGLSARSTLSKSKWSSSNSALEQFSSVNSGGDANIEL